MKRIRQFIPAALLYMLILGLPVFSQINELLPVLHLTAGKATTVDVRDLFTIPDYDQVRFDAHARISVHYDARIPELRLQTQPDVEGLRLLRFHYRSQAYYLLLQCQVQQRLRFRYRPEASPEKLTLFGSFNSWNRDNLPLQDPDGDGVYEVEVALNPGRYEYKFFLDGREVIDPDNPDKVKNPFGSYNSLITVKPRHPEQAYLHIGGFKTSDSKLLRLHFIYQPAGENALLLRPEEVIALIDNQPVAPQQINISQNRLTVTLPTGQLPGEHRFRVAVERQGVFTPIQQVVLFDGRPGGPDSPFTWSDAILYSIMIDRFSDGDPGNTRPVQHDSLLPPANFQGGDLQGVLAKLREGYFDSLGVNVLWLSPVIQNPDSAYREWPEPHRYYTGYHGYWPVHPTRVDARFGDMQLLRTLVDEAHRRKIRVLLDYVANHVHKNHPFFKEHRDWFGILELPDGRKNIRFWDEYRLTTWFEPYLPSFDYVGSDAALEVMTDNAVWWLEQTGIDGFRHDAVKHIPNRFWRLLTRKIKTRVAPKRGEKIFQIGETFGSYQLVSSYVNNGQLDAQFNFNLYDAALPVFLEPQGDFAVLDGELRKTFEVYGMYHRMGNVMDSHDKVRYLAYADGDIRLGAANDKEIGWSNPPRVDDPLSYRKARLYQAYLLSIPGTPVIYYGDEIGLTGAADPDNRRMMRFGDQLSAHEKEMKQQVQKMIRIRRDHSALRQGDFYTLLADQNGYTFIRSDVHQRILVVLNKNTAPREFLLNIPEVYRATGAVSLKTGQTIPVSDSKLSVRLEGVDWEMFQLESRGEAD